MSRQIRHIAVTGGAGNIAYSLLFRLAAGELFGSQQRIALHILEVPQAEQALEGVKMELVDCAFPLLAEIHTGSNPHKVFKDVEIAFLVGAKPRGPGMERGDLLSANGKIFAEQGAALNAVADRNVKVLVVGNPCNTNALIALKNAPDIPHENFHAMTRLDQNRAQALLAEKVGVPVSHVTNVCIWGNHSTTQVPDFTNAKIEGQQVSERIKDEAWLKETFIPKVQKRGAEIIAARGKSSAASAANAAIDAMRALFTITPAGEWFSSGVYTAGNPYGIDADLVFSLPCRAVGDGRYEVVKDVPWNAFIEERVKASEAELKEERHLVEETLTV